MSLPFSMFALAPVPLTKVSGPSLLCLRSLEHTPVCRSGTQTVWVSCFELLLLEGRHNFLSFMQISVICTHSMFVAIICLPRYSNLCWHATYFFPFHLYSLTNNASLQGMFTGWRHFCTFTTQQGVTMASATYHYPLYVHIMVMHVSSNFFFFFYKHICHPALKRSHSRALWRKQTQNGRRQRGRRAKIKAMSLWAPRTNDRLPCQGGAEKRGMKGWRDEWGRRVYEGLLLLLLGSDEAWRDWNKRAERRQ